MTVSLDLTEDDLLEIHAIIRGNGSYRLREKIKVWIVSSGFRCLWCDGYETGPDMTIKQFESRYRRDENGRPIHHSRCFRRDKQ